MRELPVEPGKMLESQGKGSYFQSTKKIKMLYKKRIREEQAGEISCYTNDLHEALLKKWAGFLESLEIKI